MKDVVLFSGGPDAFLAWEYLKKPYALYIPHGCKYDEKQLQVVYKIRSLTREYDKIKVSDNCLDLGVFEEKDSNLPLRNMYFIMIAANYGYEKIWLIVQKGEQSIPDRTPAFLKRMSNELSIQLGKEITVDCIFKNWTKQDMVKWYVDEGYNIDLLKETVSCFHPELKNCGACPACFRRFIAFEYNNIHEEYSNDILQWEGTKKYIEKLKEGKYDKRRTKQTLDVLKRFGLV